MWRWKTAHFVRAVPSLELAQRSECRTDLDGEKLRLVPRREVTAFREPVVVN